MSTLRSYSSDGCHTLSAASRISVYAYMCMYMHVQGYHVIRIHMLTYMQPQTYTCIYVCLTFYGSLLVLNGILSTCS